MFISRTLTKYLYLIFVLAVLLSIFICLSLLSLSIAFHALWFFNFQNLCEQLAQNL